MWPTILVLLSISLANSLDAFSVSLTKGVTVKEKTIKYALICGLWFGIFQTLMPLIGYFIGGAIIQYIAAFDHYVIFGILLLLGIKMIVESFKKDEEKKEEKHPFGFVTMLLLSLATSVDALSTGLVITTEDINIYLAIAVIGSVTFLMCMLGVFLGKKFGDILKNKATLIGGIILILLGTYILLNHLLDWGF
ncbi:MAG: manganese efflux pump MntP family protein [Erysipelotrichaceae bacterium]|jgi:putative Mn2+ efflux pump MntP|nr:manganese efflux pump MntP family protein [Erysipelotrichaceae bacterium]